MGLAAALAALSAWLAIIMYYSCFLVYAAGSKRPNFVVIIADDLDSRLSSTSNFFMPALNKQIAGKGLNFVNFFTTQSLCCQSRLDFFTGRHIQNLGPDFVKPDGSLFKFLTSNITATYLPKKLRTLGYNTHFIGGFLKNRNAVTPSQINYTTRPFPAGWTSFQMLTDSCLYDYNNPRFHMNSWGNVSSFSGQYQTSVLGQLTAATLTDSVATGAPFFLNVAPTAPHCTGAGSKPPIPDFKYRQLYCNTKTTPPESMPNFNEADVSDKPEVVQETVGQLTPVSTARNMFLERVRSLKSLDDLINAVVQQLESAGVINNTYIILTSDNGYHIGNHRFRAGKRFAYEEDAAIPFYVRGPGVPPGVISQAQASLIDFTPTLLSLAGGKLPADYYDGKALAFNGEEQGHEVVYLYLGWTDVDPLGPLGVKTTYRAVRVCHNTTYNTDQQQCYKYVAYCAGDHELYNLTSDPYELSNLFHPSPPPALSPLAARLDAALSVMVKCKGKVCGSPMAQVPTQDLPPLTSFADSLDPIYDSIFTALAPLKFKACLNDARLSNLVTWYTPRQTSTYASRARALDIEDGDEGGDDDVGGDVDGDFDPWSTGQEVQGDAGLSGSTYDDESSLGVLDAEEYRGFEGESDADPDQIGDGYGWSELMIAGFKDRTPCLFSSLYMEDVPPESTSQPG